MSEIAAAFEIHDLLKERAEKQQAYLPFFDVPTLRMGIYFLEAGSEDPQSPHEEDEVYYTLSGRGVLKVEGDTFAAQPGTLLFVKAHAKHRFEQITEDLTLLVFFSSAESS